MELLYIFGDGLQLQKAGKVFLHGQILLLCYSESVWLCWS